MKQCKYIFNLLCLALLVVSCSSGSFPLMDTDITYMQSPVAEKHPTIASYITGSYSQNASFDNQDISSHGSAGLHYSYANKQLGSISLGAKGYYGSYSLAAKNHPDKQAQDFSFMGGGMNGSFNYNLTPLVERLNVLTGVDFALTYEMGDYATYRKEQAEKNYTNFDSYFNITGGFALDVNFVMSQQDNLHAGLRNIAYFKEHYGDTRPYGVKSIFYIQGGLFGFFYQMDNILGSERSIGQLGLSFMLDKIVATPPKKKKRKKRRRRNSKRINTQ